MCKWWKWGSKSSYLKIQYKQILVKHSKKSLSPRSDNVRRGRLSSNMVWPACSWKTFLWQSKRPEANPTSTWNKRWSHGGQTVLRNRQQSAHVRRARSPPWKLVWLYSFSILLNMKTLHNVLLLCMWTALPSPSSFPPGQLSTTHKTFENMSCRRLDHCLNTHTPLLCVWPEAFWIYGWAYKRAALLTVWPKPQLHPGNLVWITLPRFVFLFFSPKGLRWQREGQSTEEIWIESVPNVPSNPPWFYKIAAEKT